MARFSTTIVTPWHPQDAFEYLADVRNFARWDPGVRMVQARDDQAPGVGATYGVVVKSGPGSMMLRYEVIEFVAPTRIVLRAETRMLCSLDEIRVEPYEDGAQVTYDADLTLRRGGRVAEPLLAVAFRRIGGRAAVGLARALAATVNSSV